MRYMVILHLGRDEDQNLSCIILHLDQLMKLTPREILTKFKYDFTTACLEEIGNQPLCSKNPGCAKYGVQRGNYCSHCGGQLEKKLLNREDITKNASDFLAYSLFPATVDSMPQSFIDVLESNGWEIWGPEYKSDKIVSISDVDAFFEDEDSWSDSCAKVENWI